MKNLIVMFLMCLLILSCGQYERIGSFNYKIRFNKVFTGDYGGVVVRLKNYHFKGKDQAGVVLSSQLGFDNHADTIYTYGFSKIDTINRRLIMKEYYYYGYAKALQTDSIVRIFQQLANGELKLTHYSRYYDGKIFE